MICWLTDKIGTSSGDLLKGEHDDAFYYIDLRSLVDKNGNESGEIGRIIHDGAKALDNGRKVVVVCDYGISRSNSIAAGIVSLHYKMDLADAFSMVLEKTGGKEIKSDMLDVVWRALIGNDDKKKKEKRILVTGGSGFIAGYLVPLLQEDYEVRIPGRSEVDLAAGSLPLDLYVRKHDITHVVHLANPRVFTSNKAMGDTLAMLKNVIDVCRHNNIKLIYPSGHEAFSGYRASDLLVDCQTPLLAKGVYGECKVLCENLIGMYRSRCELDATVIRATPLFGCGTDKPKFIYTFIEMAKKGQSIKTHMYKNSPARISLLHVSDFARAVKSVIVKDFTGNINVGGACQSSTFDIAKYIVSALNSTSAVEFKHIDEYVSNVRFDNSYALDILGWKPEISELDGLAEIINFTNKR